MSEWYEAEDIDLDFNKKEVDIFVKRNDWGNVYVTLTFDQIKKLNKTIMEAENVKNNQGR